MAATENGGSSLMNQKNYNNKMLRIDDFLNFLFVRM
jgi:hypothetical protein